MVFSSIEFILYFLPVFLILYGITPKRYKNVMLLAGSIVFYAFGEAKYILLLLVSLVLNYLVLLGLAKADCKKESNFGKALLVGAITVNIGILAVFKWGAGMLGFPLGMSFYTFQIISFLVDSYKGRMPHKVGFVKFSAAVMMFPKLISGPITRYDRISEAMEDREFTAYGLQDGLKVFTVGLSFKVLLADPVSSLWHQVTVTGFESISTPMAWLAAFAYSLEIYLDFYGYSLMAVGIGRMLGFDLPQNFKDPYMAKGVRDFYRRWHMTLGAWFRDYVYIALGGNRQGELRTVLNLLAVWVLTGLWHGSTWNFLIWGILLWFFIVVERWIGRLKVLERLEFLPRLYLWCVIPVTWMCFAITDIGQLQLYLGRMLGLVEGINVNAMDWQWAAGDYKWILIWGCLACTPLLRRVYERVKDTWIGQFALVILFWWCIQRLAAAGENPFMYFRF